jgi:hypothetical protein
MTSKIKLTPRKEEMLEKEGPEGPPDSPPIDRSNASVKALVRSAKKRGYVTHEQINSLIKEVNSDQIEDTFHRQAECFSHASTGLRRGFRTPAVCRRADGTVQV